MEEAVAKHKLSRTPRIVAVSKLKPPSMIQELYDVGHRHFGENYVQEFCQKAGSLPKDIQWHFIGHLQTNKCKDIVKVPNVLIETVDSVKLAKELNKRLKEHHGTLSIMVQVNTTNEQQKSGVSPDELSDIIEFIVSECPKLKIVGLMTIGKFGDPSPDYFKTLVECKEMVFKSKYRDHFNKEAFELSMGMSADYLMAIEMGSTNVRIGSTIFGARPPKSNVQSAVQVKDDTLEAKEDESTNNDENHGDNDEQKDDK